MKEQNEGEYEVELEKDEAGRGGDDDKASPSSEVEKVPVCRKRKSSLTIEIQRVCEVTVKVRRPDVGFLQISRVEVYTTTYITTYGKKRLHEERKSIHYFDEALIEDISRKSGFQNELKLTGLSAKLYFAGVPKKGK